MNQEQIAKLREAMESYKANPDNAMAIGKWHGAIIQAGPALVAIAERTTAPVSPTDEKIIEAIDRPGFAWENLDAAEQRNLLGSIRALLAAAPAPIQQEPVKGEVEAHKLARILWNMVEAVEDYDGPEIYRDGYQSADGDVFVHRAGHLLVEQQAEIAELTRYVDSFGSQLAEFKAATSPALAGSQVQAAGDEVNEREAFEAWQREKQGWLYTAEAEEGTFQEERWIAWQARAAMREQP